ncbi:hypothetical protein JXR93_10790 [bacterium]|nr:hypothetical protein [bacterium]
MNFINIFVKNSLHLLYILLFTFVSQNLLSQDFNDEYNENSFSLNDVVETTEYTESQYNHEVNGIMNIGIIPKTTSGREIEVTFAAGYRFFINSDIDNIVSDSIFFEIFFGKYTSTTDDFFSFFKEERDIFSIYAGAGYRFHLKNRYFVQGSVGLKYYHDTVRVYFNEDDENLDGYTFQEKESTITDYTPYLLLESGMLIQKKKSGVFVFKLGFLADYFYTLDEFRFVIQTSIGYLF